MLKKELEAMNDCLRAENDILHIRWAELLGDLKEARAMMADDASRLEGSIQQADLVISRMENPDEG